MALPLGLSSELVSVGAGVLAVGVSFTACIVALAAFKLMRRAVGGSGASRAVSRAHESEGYYDHTTGSGSKYFGDGSEQHASGGMWGPRTFPEGHPGSGRSHVGPSGKVVSSDRLDDHAFD
jgi:hypothetical protein